MSKLTPSVQESPLLIDSGRRKTLSALGAFSLIGAANLTGCGGPDSPGSSSSSSSSSSSNSTSSSSGSVGQCVLIPTETIGPFPLSAILSNSAMVRKDITEGKTGVPLRVKLRIVNTRGNCANFPYASVYIWHCDKDGVYSGYAQPGANAVGQTFLRGIQDADANGDVEFLTIYPGWYPGRVAHIHFQVFLYNNVGGSGAAVSQLAFPDEVNSKVYASSMYAAKGQNPTTNSRDGVFSDGIQYQIASVTGDVTSGFEAFLVVGIAAA